MEIQIDGSGLRKIAAADQRVTLTRSVTGAVDVLKANAASLIVAWQAFVPMQENTINWGNQYFCFATSTTLVMNAVITMNSQSNAPMQAGFVYQFAQGQFAMQQPPQDENRYIVTNATQNSLAFGLAQSVTVNGQPPMLAPLCVVPVGYNQSAYFNPSATIGIFLSNAAAAGTLLPPPRDACLVSAPKGGGSEPVIGFDDQTNAFYQKS